MAEGLKIKLLTMWQGFPAGRELRLGTGQAQLLIQRGIAEAIEGKALNAPPENKAIAKPAETKATKKRK